MPHPTQPSPLDPHLGLHQRDALEVAAELPAGCARLVYCDADAAAPKTTEGAR